MRANAFKIDAVQTTDLREALNKPFTSWRDYRAAQKEAHGFSRVFFSVKDETVMDQLINRRVRPRAEWRKLMPEVLEKAGIDPQKVRWSQYAGCSCPCSPGFICTESTGKRVWVEVSGNQ